ncbi:MAG TPA: hypothetical protein VM141_01110 [Planctomycetota bacterium]|nr:hypothetical protein [Planctomycetota bacterium]
MSEQDVEQTDEQTVDQADAGGSESLPADPGGDPHGEKADENGQDGLVLDTLARLPEKTMLDEAALAKALHVAPRTVRRMVARWQIPPAVTLGGRSVWFAGRVLAHIEAAAERAAKGAERDARRFRENFT